MPFKTGGLNAGLKCTMTPGLGKDNSCAPAGIGPKVLSKNAATIKAINGDRFSIYIEWHINIRKQGIGKTLKKAVSSTGRDKKTDLKR